ncbi:DoxX family protein [Pedobacter aquatilis]|uniref:DoxX family protein n=1 Tax=Pedobacter aquatilis TaxID=351343 RepID=UPI00292FEB32|nr:DoxX family protein [Pedobacter aquatilis]
MKYNKDLGKLLLRVSLALSLIFHGFHKLIHGHDFIISSLQKNNLPEFLWLGVPLAELIAPLCLVLGILTRISATAIMVTMIMTIVLVLGTTAFNMNKVGGLQGELNLLIFLVAASTIFIGPGRLRVFQGNNKWLI